MKRRLSTLHPVRRARSAPPAAVLLVLAVLLALAAAGCGAPEAPPEGEAAATAEAEPEPPYTPMEPPLPEPAAEDGTLPRTYAGLTLGDPPPEGFEKTEQPPAFYPSAEQYNRRLADNPVTVVAAFVHEGTIFRIEWRTRNENLDRDEIAAAFAERLGEPEESDLLPDHLVHWNDGVAPGSTAYNVYRIPGSDWLRVAVEDALRASELMVGGGAG